jgi:hypothetical protein
MIRLDAHLSVYMLPLDVISVEHYERRDLVKVRFFVELLLQHPEHTTEPITVKGDEHGGSFKVRDGHHRFLAHIAAGRSSICAVIVNEAQPDAYVGGTPTPATP